MGWEFKDFHATAGALGTVFKNMNGARPILTNFHSDDPELVRGARVNSFNNSAYMVNVNVSPWPFATCFNTLGSQGGIPDTAIVGLPDTMTVETIGNYFPDGYEWVLNRRGTRDDRQGYEVRPAWWNDLDKGYPLYEDAQLVLKFSLSARKFLFQSFTPSPTITESNLYKAGMPLRFFGTGLIRYTAADVDGREVFDRCSQLPLGASGRIVHNEKFGLKHVPGEIEIEGGQDYLPDGPGELLVVNDEDVYRVTVVVDEPTEPEEPSEPTEPEVPVDPEPEEPTPEEPDPVDPPTEPEEPSEPTEPEEPNPPVDPEPEEPVLKDPADMTDREIAEETLVLLRELHAAWMQEPEA